MKTLADLDPVLKNARDLAGWIAHHQDGLEINTLDSIKVPVALFDLAIEYQVGIAHLASARIYGPAFALIRAQFEALRIRGSDRSHSGCWFLRIIGIASSWADGWC